MIEVRDLLISGSLGSECRVLNFRKLLHRNVQRFRGGLVFKAHRRLYHSTLGLRVIKNKEEVRVIKKQKRIMQRLDPRGDPGSDLIYSHTRMVSSHLRECYRVIYERCLAGLNPGCFLARIRGGVSGSKSGAMTQIEERGQAVDSLSLA